MKKFILMMAEIFGKFWGLIPKRIRLGIIVSLILIESRSGKLVNVFKNLFEIKDKVDWVINERSMFYGLGEHPKHRLTKYHDFFIQRIQNSNKVLDIGCGYGAVARSVANAHPDCQVLGVDMDLSRLDQARKSTNLPNLKYLLADATKDLPPEKWDVVILSNVLEHIADRVVFLRKIKETINPKKFLIRVPNFERDWQIALRKEIGADYFSDADHKIEHTIQEFEDEITQAGLSIVNLSTPWGEIWAECI
ncbi:MAG: class I SAM-dependent methyltransferase [Beijerinckiaceae bacterium]|nr:class I SAM-dependent methyltransferase [Beijerinckiaceae bacterium]